MSMSMYGEEDNPDPLVKQRIKCLQEDCHVQNVFKVLEECNARVTKKIKYTAETCSQEMVDLAEAVDHCAAHKAWHHLK